MKLLGSLLALWSFVVYTDSLPNRNLGNCNGVQVTRGQQGGIYYVDAGNRQNTGWGSSSNHQPVVDTPSNSFGTNSNQISSQFGTNSGSGWAGSGVSYYSNAVFARDVLAAHNVYRARHNTPPVTLSPSMSSKAQAWADEIASGQVRLGHSGAAVDGTYGESLQVVNDPNPSGGEVIDHWYSEMDNYDYTRPQIVKRPVSRRNSHFTSMVWYGTKEIGVGKAVAPDGRTFVVVNYFPPGNNVDTLEDNVYPPRQ